MTWALGHVSCLARQGQRLRAGLPATVIGIALTRLYSRARSFQEDGSGGGDRFNRVSLGREAIRLGYSVLFVLAMALIAVLARAHAEGRPDERLAHYGKPKLLIIDELGYLPVEANAAHLFFQLVSRRYKRGSVLITSNRSIGEWGTVFGDAVVATAILDRLLHHWSRPTKPGQLQTTEGLSGI